MAVDMGGRFVEEEPGERHGALLVVLGGVQGEDALLVYIRMHHVSLPRIDVTSLAERLIGGKFPG